MRIEDTDDFNFYEEEETARPFSKARQRRIKEKKIRQQASSSQPETRAGWAEASNPKARPNTTYRLSRHEEGWLLDSLSSFYEDQLITDVLYHVKGGKEASVYCCQAHPATGLDLVAAKVYRPREMRSMRNDAIYREGRGLLTAQGRALLGERGRKAQKPTGRVMRAVAAKSAFGQEVLHSSWLSYEFMFMERLYKAGAAVPQPVACGSNAVLMSFYGDESRAAPTIGGVRLELNQAKALFNDVMHTIGLMLDQGYVHGDLSAYNLLYWEGRVIAIDFPQVADLYNNPNAYSILERDITRVCEYFARQGVRCNAAALTDKLWKEYMTPEQALHLPMLNDEITSYE